jgi:hypothetical protein
MIAVVTAGFAHLVDKAVNNALGVADAVKVGLLVAVLGGMAYLMVWTYGSVAWTP